MFQVYFAVLGVFAALDSNNLARWLVHEWMHVIVCRKVYPRIDYRTITGVEAMVVSWSLNIPP